MRIVAEPVPEENVVEEAPAEPVAEPETVIVEEATAVPAPEEQTEVTEPTAVPVQDTQGVGGVSTSTSNMYIFTQHTVPSI